MRAEIRNGALARTPASVAAAAERRARLLEEVAKIDLHLADPVCVARHELHGDGAVWRKKAKTSRELFAEEARLLAAWIASQPPPPPAPRDDEVLLRDAYELLKDLELDVDFEPEDTALMERLDERFSDASASKGE